MCAHHANTSHYFKNIINPHLYNPTLLLKYDKED